MSLMGIITGGWTDIAKAKEERKAVEAAQEAQNAAFARESGLQQESAARFKPFYDQGLAGFTSYASAINGTVDPTTGRSWTPESSPAFDWQQQQAMKQQNRQLRALGRSNSTFGMNARNDLYNKLYSSEYDKQLGRLADLTNIGRGGASSLAGINRDMSQSSINQGDSLANYLLADQSIKSRGMGEFDTGLNQAAGIVGSLYGGGLFSGKKNGGQ
jgi:hypothetical protein